MSVTPAPARSRRSTARALLLWARTLPPFLCFGTLLLLLRLVISRRHIDRLLKWGCRTSIRMLGVAVRVEGQDRLDPNGLYTFMFNHVTAIDHIIIYGVLPHWGRGLEAAENFRIPFYGWIMWALGNYPIKRKRSKATLATLARCAREAKEEGFSVFCAPEGTRSRDGLLGHLKSGVFRLAMDCGRDIAPIALLDCHPILPPGEWRLCPQPVTVRILEPIPVRSPSGESFPLDELKSRVLAAFVSAGLRRGGSAGIEGGSVYGG
jgi:1-acyl-sn-glycerol-3-phosphate acyltransferase